MASSRPAWLVLLALSLACGRAEDPAGPDAAEPTPAFAGAARCAGCHPDEASAWRGSDHDRAMEEPAARLGDFGGVRFAADGVESVFFERNGRAFVRTEGPDGRPDEFPVAYTFGFFPVQQLLLPLPGGRLQAFTVAWDARPRGAGGQRWYTLHPDETLRAGDPLHWSGAAQSWNAGCAECHATNLRKGFDLARGAYKTTWSDPDVACEACHGPGARHVAWAEGGAPAGGPALPVRLGGEEARWAFAEGAAIAQRTPPRAPGAHAELEVCAPCHARRTVLREGHHAGEPFLDTHRPALLERGLYEADGQIDGEVYELGSFLQSRMFAAGVTCSDCHEPHRLALRAEGNALCATCHRPAVFDVPAHHRHAPGSAGAACVSCHMPARTYMGVDVRHDHSFRVPRPDLSVALGTPNACTDCHADRPPRSAADAVARWFPGGRTGVPHYGAALHAGREAQPGAEAALRALALDAAQPAIARATALGLLAAPELPASADAIRRGLADRDGWARLGAVAAAEGLEPSARAAALIPLLADPLRAVRIDAARILADAPPEAFRPEERSRLAAALGEYRAAQQVAADRPEAQVSLGALAVRLGDPAAARAAYEAALRLAPTFAPAWVNLADLERSAGREDAAEAALRRALDVAPEYAEPHYALGLLLVRTGRRDEALGTLARAAALAPGDARFALAHALALAESGERPRALAALEAALARRPADRELRATAALLARDGGDAARALHHARALTEAWPDDPRAHALRTNLERR